MVSTPLSAARGPSAVTVLALLAATTTIARPAPAQSGELDVAAQFFEAGVAAARKREFRVCAEAFTEANKRAPHGATIYNAALCWDGEKDAPRAANAYDEALRLGSLSQKQKKEAEKRLSELRTDLGQLEVSAPSGVRASVGPIAQQPIPFTTFLPPGEHEIQVEGPDGDVISKSVTIVAGASKRIEIDLAKPEPPATPKPDATTDGKTSTSNVQRNTGWVLVGAGAVAVGVGAAFYASAITARDEFDADRTDREARERALDRYSVARALWIGGGVAAAAGLTLVLTAPKPEQRPSASLGVTAGGVSARLTF